MIATLVVMISLAQAPADAGASLNSEEELFALDRDVLRLVVPVVQTASRREEKASDAPGTVLVITRDDIRLRGYSVLTDVLRDLPGMEAHENFFAEFGTLVPIRGVAGNNKIIVLYNGMRVNPPGGENMMFRSDISMRDVDQVEIVYGPGSTLYGQDAISAVINIISQKKQIDYARAGVVLGYPFRKEAWLSANKRLGQSSISATASVIDADLTDLRRDYHEEWARYQAELDARPSVGGYKRWDRGLNLTLRAETNAEFGSASVQIFHRQSGRSTSQGFGPGFNLTEAALFADASTVGEASLRIKLSERVDAETVLTLNRYEIDPRSRYIFALPGEWAPNDYKYGLGTSLGFEERVSGKILDNLSLTGGFSLQHFSIIPKATIPGPNDQGLDRNLDIIGQAGEFTYYTEANNPDSRVTINRANILAYQNIAGYLEAAYRPLDWLKITAGARLDKNTRIKQLPFSPRAAVLVSPTSWLAVKYIFTRAFVAPAPYFSYNVFDDGTAINQANPGLLPEQAMSNELNVTLNHKLVTAGVSAYYNNQDNLILVGDAKTPVNIVLPSICVDLACTQTRLLTQSANSGRSVAFGFDLYARVKVASLAGWASYSFVDFKSFDAAGAPTPMRGISRHNWRLGLTYRFLESLFATASMMLRSVPEGYVVDGPLAAYSKVPFEVNVHLDWEPIKRLGIFIDVRNATFSRYSTPNIGGGPAPVDTLRFFGGVRYSLE